MSDFAIRQATPADVQSIKRCIEALADYEKLAHEVIVTEEQLRQSLFESRDAHCLLAYLDEVVIGFAVYFYNYSTFLGAKGLYLEDLFVMPHCRGRGYGKQLLLHLVQLAKEEDCGRMEWSVLNWNTPAIDFYKSLGAEPMQGWTTFRLTRSGLENLAE